ncbi:IS66 family transposase [Candidatus Venteria ishoeyi]|uniref:Transposase IS66 family protein n=1 Tax=Candidatus Venteria ishoeyi TaxID=1899563 RepID=A0A1H6FBX7_9GAMM|nr:transposase [Candidatus Venteria ishoeyi]SEH06646.1 Transposase IS66 family protein [Candidatus Venteria ishoeyi]
MTLSDNDLQQINEDWLRERTKKELLYLSHTLLVDLKEARERINQNSANSSVPSGSESPWFHPANDTDSEEDDDTPIPPPPDETENNKTQASPEQDSQDNSDSHNSKETSESKNSSEEQRKPGKQLGAQGFGRTQKLPITGVEHHYACHCAGCGQELTGDTPKRAYTGFYTIDIEYGEPDKPGIRISNIKHLYYDSSCDCGHTTRIAPHREPPEELFEGIELTEWRLVGPALMSLIIFLNMRMRMSRPRIQEFLLLWLNIELSTGTINQCIHEGGRAVDPIENQMVKELLDSKLLHADETTWLIAGKPFWLWVFASSTVTLYYITLRSNELVRNLLGEYKGWLMSDGYKVYREIHKRLRCWAHLLRKAKGIAESLNLEAGTFGKNHKNCLKR